MINIIHPKHTCETIRIPRSEQRGCDTDQVVKNGNADGQDESGAVHERDEQDPGAPAYDRVAVQMSTVTEETDEEEFGGDVRVETSCDEEIGNCDPIRRFLPFYRQRREGGGGDCRTDVDVHDYCEDGVEGCSEYLEDVGGAHGVLRVMHFGYEDEKHEMARVCEDGVCDRDECGDEIGGYECLDGVIWDRVETGADHTDDAGDHD